MGSGAERESQEPGPGEPPNADVPSAGRAATQPSCRTRRRARPLSPGGQRPADQLTLFFASAIAFLVAGALTAALHAAGALDWWGRWLALHLLLLGGVSQLVIGAAQFFSTAFLATDPPSRRFVLVELVAWAVGSVLVAGAIPVGASVLADVGATVIVADLVLFGVGLRALERKSLRKARWAVRWYYACATFLVVGALVGMLLARGTAWTHGSLLGAHLALNLAGWLGTAIVGTLHTFYPSLAQSRLASERLQGPTFVAWIAGVAVLATGYGFGMAAATVVGWLLLAVAALMLCANLVATRSLAEGPPPLPGRLVGVAQLFLLAGLACAVAMQLDLGAGAAPAGAWRAALAALLLAGWIGMTVAGSLLHLLTVLHRVRNLRAAMPRPRPGRDAVQTAAAALGVLALAVSNVSGLGALKPLATLVLIGAFAPVAARIVALAVAAVVQRLASGRRGVRPART